MAARIPQLAASSGPSVGGVSTGSASIVAPQVLAMSDATVPQIDSHLMDYLNIEMMHILLEAASHAQSRYEERRAMIELDWYSQKLAAGQITADQMQTEPENAPVDKTTPAYKQAVEDRFKYRLDGVGYRLGYVIAERLSKDRPPIPKFNAPATTLPTGAAPLGVINAPFDSLEVVKFLCKDIWAALYDKQIDNLRTNHRGVFVLTDNAFKPIVRLSTPNPQHPAMREATDRKVRQMLYMPCGIVRGTLAVLGMQATVTVESAGGAQCVFTIKTTPPMALPKTG